MGPSHVIHVMMYLTVFIQRYKHSFTDAGSFSKLKRTCKICDFECKNQDSMQVQLGKYHSEHLECGLCEAGFEELSKLQMHLIECGSCKIKIHI